MQDSSLNNYSNNRNFVIMLVILFLMEFARGMYILSYINFLPTVTSIAIAITSFAFSIHFIADAATNFVIGFLLKKFVPKWYLLLAFTRICKFIFSDLVSSLTFVIIFSSIMLGIAVSPIWVIMLSSVEENNRGKTDGLCLFLMVTWFISRYGCNEFINQITSYSICIYDVISCSYSLILYYFVNIKLTNYNTKPVPEQLKQIVDVTKRHLVLFPGYYYRGSYSSTSSNFT